MIRFSLFIAASILTLPVQAETSTETQAIEQAARDYLESQHKVSPAQMKNSLHTDLKKRTYWENREGDEYILETDYQTMIRVAETYNKNGDRFPADPRIEIEILDIDQRVASVKLTADDWIDYMHLFKSAEGDWKIINVLWQYHDIQRHSSKN